MVYEIAERPDRVEVVGATADEIRDALTLLDRVRARQREHAAAVRDELTAAAIDAGMPLATGPALIQAERLATRRASLLAQPTYSYEELGDLIGIDSTSSVRTWLHRRRQERSLFSVTQSGRTVIPAFQFDPEGRPRADLRPLLEALLAGGVDGWQLWAWLTSPSNLLSGEVPEAVAATNPARATRAALRFVAQLAPGG